MADELSSDNGSKTKLLQDMQTLLQKIATEYDKIDAKSKSISANLKGINTNLGSGSAGANAQAQIAASGGTYSGGFSNYMQSQGGVMGFAKNIASTVIGAGSAALSALPSVQQAVSSQLLTSQARFTGMQGNVNSTVRSLMGMGTTSSSTDVQQAIAQGAAAGLLPGMPGYNDQIMPGVMQLSNLTGSAQSGMRAATALNSGQSVNTLRMMGISVRGANGAERNPAAIFKDIYNFAVQQSGGKLNASNIAIALQPGNGLANLLDAAAGGDQTLRDALQNAALQFSKGGDLSKASLTKTGQLTGALNSQSALNQSQFGLLAASQDPMAKGFAEANNLLVKVTDKLSKYVEQNQGLIKQLAKGETLIGSQIGQAATGIISALTAGLGALGVGKLASKAGSSLFGKIGGFFKRNAKTIVKDAEVGLLETQAAVAEVGTLGTVGTADEIATQVAVAGILSHAAGGRVQKGREYDVGEYGREKFIPDQSGTIVPYHRGNILNGGGGSGLGQGATVSPQASNLVASGAVSAVLATSASLQGIPYSWGGGSINGPTTGTAQGSQTVGFDCSSFVQFVFARVGIMLPRTTYAQVNCGQAVPPTQAQPGDLLFFGNPQAPHHVAIYVGGGMLIQAPQTGQTISKTGVDLRTVAACRRLINAKTGTAYNGNVLKVPNGSVTGPGTSANSLFAGLIGNTMSGNSGDLGAVMGMNPADAMSGGSVGGSGLGQGAANENYNYGSTNMGQTYLSINTKTGILESSPRSAAGTTINYGGVTIPITLPQGTQIDPQQLASAIKSQLTSININTKVASS